MSTATVSGRSRVQPRPEQSPRPTVRAVPTTTPPARAPFVVVMLLLLTVGLGTILLLNTLLAQGSFTLHALKDRVAALTDTEQALQQRASELAAPQRLARRAQELGMVASQNPAFLNEADGKVLGEPVPASAPAPPPPPAPLVDPDDSGNGPSSGAKNDEKPDSTNADKNQGASQGGGNQNGGNQGANQGGGNQGGGNGGGNGGGGG